MKEEQWTQNPNKELTQKGERGERPNKSIIKWALEKLPLAIKRPFLTSILQVRMLKTVK
jgi:hypothetical protein